MKLTITGPVFLSIFILGLIYTPPVNADTYEFINLSAASAVFGVNSTNILLSDINDAPEVVGTTRSSNGKLRAFSWKDGVAVDLGHLGFSGDDVRVWDINNQNQIIGEARNNSGVPKIIIWQDGSKVAYNNSDGNSYINDLSFYATPGGVWKEGVFISGLPQLNPTSPFRNRVFGINNENVVVGESFSSVRGSYVPVYWKDGSLFTTLNVQARAVGINNRNEIIIDAGIGTGYVWKNGQILKSFSNGSPIAINDQGVVLVYFYGGQSGSVEGQALWSQEDGIVYLRDLIENLPADFSASDINNNGDIIGSTATDRFLVKRQIVTNTAPTLAPIIPQTTTEGTELTFTLSATDAEDDVITYSAINLPSGATLDETTGVFTWTPDFNDEGEYEVTFTATENTPEALSDSETVTISVINFNRAPELASIGNQTVNEGDTLEFNVSATDEDNDNITISATNLPSGATFNGTTFSWNTTYTDAGNYENIEFTATDNGTPMELDVEIITITVGDVNRMPELTNPGPQEVLEEETVSFTISASDPDNDTVTITASNLPSGATFNGSNFTWTPDLSDEGVYTVTFTATDNGTPTESASTDVVITVGDNPTPVEQAQNLIELVVTFDLPQNVENSYMANLQKVGQFIADGKITPALNQLNAFKNKVQQDYQQGSLTQAEYQQLMDAANDLISDLNN